jgi:hypothetical protein
MTSYYSTTLSYTLFFEISAEIVTMNHDVAITHADEQEMENLPHHFINFET